MGEEEFISKLRNLVQSRLDDKMLGVEDLVKAGYTSRASLYRKLKKTVNQTASGFILEQRLKEAQKLLKAKPTYSIGEISEKVGFKDQAYFSRRFKEHTGASPLKYRQGRLGEGEEETGDQLVRRKN